MKSRWRRGALALVLLVPLAVLLSLDPIPQSLAYHDFADRRTVLGIPNFADVVSNLVFFAVGLWGLVGAARWEAGEARLSWRILFAGLALLCFGSVWYHLSPDNDTLVWDRLAIGIVCAALLIAVLSENVAPCIQRWSLAPALLLGSSSVVYWHSSDDLRLYIWVQLAPLLAIPALLALFPARYSHRPWLLVGLVCYGAAKLAEFADAAIFELSAGLLGGHTLKHLLAGAAIAAINMMLLRRRSLSPRTGGTTPQPGVAETNRSGFPIARE